MRPKLMSRLRIHPDFFNDCPDERPLPFVAFQETSSLYGERSTTSTLTPGAATLRDEIFEIADCDKTYEPTVTGTISHSDIRTIEEGETLDFAHGDEPSLLTISDIVTVESGGIAKRRVGTRSNKYLSSSLDSAPELLTVSKESSTFSIIYRNEKVQQETHRETAVEPSISKRSLNRYPTMPYQERVSLPQILRRAIKRGAPLYNRGDHRGCYEIYVAAAEEAIHHQSGICNGAVEIAPKKVSICVMLRHDLSQARASVINKNNLTCYTEGAWILRRSFDSILSHSRDKQQRFEI